jgi:multimeric flavodoxin WrbA
MNVLIFNGSPKTNVYSMTNQTIFSVFKKFPLHNYKFLDISANIGLIEKNNNYLENIIQEISKADLVVWSCPVYVTGIPSQFKKFIEIIIEKNLQKVFAGKYAASFTTSIRFYDHHTHYYLHSICDDFEMKYIGYYSADTDDIFKPVEREKIMKFGEILFESMEKDLYLIKRYLPLAYSNFIYEPEKTIDKIDVKGRKIVIISDYADKNENLGKMTTKFKEFFNQEITEINLAKEKILFGCQGCYACGHNNLCVLKDRDDFYKIFSETLLPADIIILAISTKDRYISSNFKRFIDRCYFMNHVPFFLGKQLGALSSGPFRQIHFSMDNLLALSVFMGANLTDLVSDEIGDSKKIDDSILLLAKNLLYFSEKKQTTSPTFLKIGGYKIFRDAVWGRYRLTLQADHRYYKKHGFYNDFPFKETGIKKFLKNNALIFLCRFPILRKKIYFRQIKKNAKKIKKINQV